MLQWEHRGQRYERHPRGSPGSGLAQPEPQDLYHVRAGCGEVYVSSAAWFRLPAWCIGRDHREEAIVVMWVLGEWHVGREVSAAGLKAEFGWGWSRSAALIDRLWAWAGDSGAARPDTARPPKRGTQPESKETLKSDAGTKPGSQRGVSGESAGSPDVDATPIVEEDRGVTGESAGSQRGVSRARVPLLEREEIREREETPVTVAEAATAPNAPTYPTWLPKAPDRPALLAAVLGCVEELRQAPVNPARCATDAREVLGLWSATGKPPPAEFAADLRLVIRAARACPHRLFARDIRAEGWAEGTDRQRSLATICRRDRWGERLEVARAWEAGSVDVGASQAARTPTPTRPPTATNSLMADALARLRRTPADPAPEPAPRLILNGDS